jgi:hypothetical protein
MAFRFSQAIDPDEVHKAFAEHGFAHISGVLPPENAQRIHKGKTKGIFFTRCMSG